MKFKSLYSRIAFTFAILILLFGGLYGWLNLNAAQNHQQEIVQTLNRGLAEHIANSWPLLSKTNDLNRESVATLFNMLMLVNPGIEVYLLDRQGLILAHQAPPGRVQEHQHVDLAPIQAMLVGQPLPLKGVNPRYPGRLEIFSAASLKNDGNIAGYLYIILIGDDYQRLAADVWQIHVFKTAMWVGIGGLLLTLIVGLGLFAVITQRLNALTSMIADFEAMNFTGRLQVPANIMNSSDEIGRLARAFKMMAERIASLLKKISNQDEQRRELVANVSHDLRTPLASMHGYLETLLRKAHTLTNTEQQHYLEVAVRQSQRVSHLAHELFELAKLECEEVKPSYEPFFIQELIQDVVQKFELTASNRQILLQAMFKPDLPMVYADIGMIERVLSNLIDNALRHTPAGGKITLELELDNKNVIVKVADTGSGIAEEHLANLFERSSPLRQSSGKAHGGGGLGLLISKRILLLHGCNIEVFSDGEGALFTFNLPTNPQRL